MTKIEQVARKIAGDTKKDWKDRPENTCFYGYPTTFETRGKKYYRKVARAAIEAMRIDNDGTASALFNNILDAFLEESHK